MSTIFDIVFYPYVGTIFRTFIGLSAVYSSYKHRRIMKVEDYLFYVVLLLAVILMFNGRR